MTFDTKKIILTLAAIGLIGVGESNAQFVGDPACYVVSDRSVNAGGGSDRLYSYDDLALLPTDPAFQVPAPNYTGVTNIEASEFNPLDQTMYAWNEDDFGTIDVTSGVFSSLGTAPGIVCGLQGGTYTCFDAALGADITEQGHGGAYDIDGMALNPISNEWYGAVRIDDGSGDVNARSDWLVKYDATGVLIPDGFGQDAAGNDIGFVEIASINPSGTFLLHDIDDLAFNPFTGQLYGIANQSGGGTTSIVEIDPNTGATTDLGQVNSAIACGGLPAGAPLQDIEGLSIDISNRIWAVTGASGAEPACNNSFWELQGALDGTPINSIYYLDMSVEDGDTDQESISCLRFEPVSVGDTIWLDLNSDGIEDAGEPGIAGVVLYIVNAAGDTLGTATTDANGMYLFGGLLPDAAGYSVIVGAENFAPGGTLETATQTGAPSGPGGQETTATSDPLPNSNDSDLTLDWGFFVPELPVELASFEGEMRNGQIDLAWTTVTEDNNSGFSIEISQDGSPFRTIGWVNGAGTTTEEQNYNYSFDVTTFSPLNVRLKQVDFDGKSSYSSTLLVSSDIPDSYILGAVYPNPFNPQASIQLSLKSSEIVTANLYDSMGRLVGNLMNGLVSANQPIEIKVDGSSIPSGTYLVKVTGESFTATRSLTLMK